jgi:DeoR family suf operon transcriptional repressor
MTTTQPTSTKQDILQLLMKRDRATAAELATALEITPQAIRRHLKDLEAEGLIQYQSSQLGMGRPQHIYQLSSQGKAQFPKGYGEFAVSFLDTLAETVGKEQVSSILRKQWERKAEEYRDRLGQGSLADRVKNLVVLRQAEGYMAEWYAVEGSSNSFILAEHNCAISEVAESFPSVCGHELEMFSVLLPDCQIERTHWLIDGEHRCGYLITNVS